MIGWLVTQQWREATRSSVWQKSLVINIILGLMMLYLLLNFLLVGFFADKIILKIFPNDDVVWRFSALFGYYLLIDILVRFLMQGLPVLSIQPYLHLPIRKKRLIHYLLGKSLFSLFNLLPLVLLLPFTVKVVAPAHNIALALAWMLSLFLLAMVNNYLVVFLKRQLTTKPLIVLAFGLALAGIFALDYYNVFSISHTFAGTAMQVFEQPLMVLPPLVLLVIIYQLNLRIMLKSIYSNELEGGQTAAVKISELSFLNRFGEVGSLIGLELKLIWRNKRPRLTMFMSIWAILLGFLLYIRAEDQGYFYALFGSLYITGGFYATYGQLLFGWESKFFDRIVTQNISSYQYIQSKFYLFTASCVVLFVLSLPLGLLSLELLVLNTVMFFFNVGVNIFIIIYMATFSPKKIDLSKGIFFNYEGMGGSQFLMMLPIALLAPLLYFPLSYIGYPKLGITLIGSVGLINLLFYKFWLQKITSRLIRKKHAIAAGFRQN